MCLKNSTIIVNNYGFFEIKLIETEGILNYWGSQSSKKVTF